MKSEVKSRQSLFVLNHETVAYVAALLYILKEVFGGVFRYFTVITGTEALNYVPPFLAIAAIGMYYASTSVTGRVHHAMLAAAVFVGIFILYGCFNSISYEQTAIGLYIWLPVFVGMLLRVQGQEDVLFKWIFVLWAVMILGMFVNSVIQFPWAGTSYEVLGVQREVARKWTYLDYDRLAGFGRSSFTTSYLILFYCCAILFSRRYPIYVRLGCYVISAYALFLTTNKTSLLLWVAIPVFLVGYEISGKVCAVRSLLPYYWAKFSVTILIVILIGLPLWSQIPTLLHDRETFYFFSFASLLDRMKYAWPASFAVLAHGGNELLGRGIGGIGTAQKFTEPDLYMFADNLFVYVFVSTGVVGTVALFYSLVVNLKMDYLCDKVVFKKTYFMLIYILGIGVVVNTIEGPFQALVLGVLVARAMTEPRRAKAVQSWRRPRTQKASPSISAKV